MASRTLEVRITGDTTGADRAFQKVEGGGHRLGGVFGKLDNALASFGVPFTGALGNMGNKLDELALKGEGTFAKLAEVGKVAALAVGVGAVAIAAESLHLADDFEKAQARLETAIKNSGSTAKAWNDTIDKSNAKLENFGFNNTDVANSLAKLVPVTKSQTEAQKFLALAADIARARHIELAAATMLVIKSSQGQTRVLKQAGIDLPFAAGGAKKLADAQNDLVGKTEKAFFITNAYNAGLLKSKTAHDTMVKAQTAMSAAQEKVNTLTNQGAVVIDALTKRFGGSAAAESETFAGKLEVLRAKLENIGIKIGMFLIPIIEKMVGAISDAISWLEQNKTVAEALGIALGVLVAGPMAAWIVSLGIAAAEAVIAAAPLLAIIAIVGLIGAAIYLLVDNWDAAWNFIANNPWVRVAIDLVTFGIPEAIRFVIDHLNDFKNIWDAIWGGISATIGGVVDVIVGAFNGLVSILETIFGLARNVADALGSVASFAGIGDKTGGFEDVQAYLHAQANKASKRPGGRLHAAGGFIAPGDWGIAGEAGAEIVMGGRAGATVLPHGVGGGGNTFIFNAKVIDQNVGQWIVDEVTKHQRRNSPAPWMPPK